MKKNSLLLLASAFALMACSPTASSSSSLSPTPAPTDSDSSSPLDDVTDSNSGTTDGSPSDSDAPVAEPITGQAAVSALHSAIENLDYEAIALNLALDGEFVYDYEYVSMEQGTTDSQGNHVIAKQITNNEYIRFALDGFELGVEVAGLQKESGALSPDEQMTAIDDLTGTVSLKGTIEGEYTQDVYDTTPGKDKTKLSSLSYEVKSTVIDELITLVGSGLYLDMSEGGFGLLTDFILDFAMSEDATEEEKNQALSMFDDKMYVDGAKFVEDGLLPPSIPAIPDVYGLLQQESAKDVVTMVESIIEGDTTFTFLDLDLSKAGDVYSIEATLDPEALLEAGSGGPQGMTSLVGFDSVVATLSYKEDGSYLSLALDPCSGKLSGEDMPTFEVKDLGLTLTVETGEVTTPSVPDKTEYKDMTNMIIGLIGGEPPAGDSTVDPGQA